MKQVQLVEITSFIEIATQYFQHVSDAITKKVSDHFSSDLNHMRRLTVLYYRTTKPCLIISINKLLQARSGSSN